MASGLNTYVPVWVESRHFGTFSTCSGALNASRQLRSCFGYYSNLTHQPESAHTLQISPTCNTTSKLNLKNLKWAMCPVHKFELQVLNRLRLIHAHNKHRRLVRVAKFWLNFGALDLWGIGIGFGN